MAQIGYYRHPSIHGDRVVFVAEDDLWQVGVEGGAAHRLTANPGTHAGPRFSPDGKLLAFTSRDEGRMEVHLMAADGGPSTRLTHFAATSFVVGWEGDDVLVATDHRQPFVGWTHLWKVPADGGPASAKGLGPATALAGSKRGTVIARHGFDPARWKRYRGGRTGSLWIDRGKGFAPLVDLDANLASPMWVGNRVYFLSDHEGVGNLYSVAPSGKALRRHTDHSDFYARFPSTDGRRIVYHAGGDLWLLDPDAGINQPVEIVLPSAVAQRNRRFVSVPRHLETFDLAPAGHSVAVTSRGATFGLALWEGAGRRLDAGSEVRERLATWLPDGERLVVISDAGGDERMVVRSLAEGDVVVIEEDLGRVRSIDPAPVGTSRVAVTNHRLELMLVDLVRKSARVIHRSRFSWIAGTAWSPDGRWLGFAAATTRSSVNLFLYDTKTRKLHRIGAPEFVDHSPVFDPDGKYLYFLGNRSYDPIPDAIFHDYGFPRASTPMAIALSASTPSPFDVTQRPPRAPGAQPDSKPSEAPVVIDLEGIEERVVPFPVPVGVYTAIDAAKDRVFFTLSPSLPTSERSRPLLQAWDIAGDRLDLVAEGVSSFALSMDRKVLGFVIDRRLRVVPVGWKDDKSGKDGCVRETGWVDLDRLKLEVHPGAEWEQMFGEAWRLQREYFWSEDMSGVDWEEVRDRYRSLVPRVSSRAEFSDLLWEMQGELGTSHAYELGGEYRPEPEWTQGMLGADLAFERGAWRVAAIPRGDAGAGSPLRTPGIGVAVGDRLLSVDGVGVGFDRSPESVLVHRAGKPVELRVARGRSKPRTVVVTPLSDERGLRYRDWVESNRCQVKEFSDSGFGYIHIPDMQAGGFAEFHRAFRAEVDCEGLVIDVRFNRGGNVSQLLLERLLRRRIGYRVTRWRELAVFPLDAPAGPMVCLTNEMAGSDGDIFSHAFKLAGLGPLIGTRTWGGVVGIWPQQSLVDGTVTTQPEFGTWFNDVGFTIENYGTEPDIEVEITPDDYRAGRDPQLERALAELAAIVSGASHTEPGVRPSTARSLR